MLRCPKYIVGNSLFLEGHRRNEYFNPKKKYMYFSGSEVRGTMLNRKLGVCSA